MSRRNQTAKIKQETAEWRMLEILEDIGDLMLDAFLPKTYWYTRLWRDVLGLDEKPSEKDRQRITKLLSNTLGRLKSKGLVQKSGSTKKAIWRLGKAGKEALEAAKQKTKPEDGKLRLFIFDIPESQKEDRAWVRAELGASGFIMLQKSVWVGKRALPEEFFRELAGRGLLEAVHLFEIKDPGTLESFLR